MQLPFGADQPTHSSGHLHRPNRRQLLVASSISEQHVLQKLRRRKKYHLLVQEAIIADQAFVRMLSHPCFDLEGGGLGKESEEHVSLPCFGDTAKRTEERPDENRPDSEENAAQSCDKSK